MIKIAIIASHPVQYYAPWFREIADQPGLELKVFYLWDFGVRARHDPGFEQAIEWDLPLLDGYQSEFVANQSRDPGTHHVRGLQNPGLARAVDNFDPAVVLLTLYNYASIYRFLCTWTSKAPLIFRGDSHRLFPGHGIRETLRRTAISLIFRRFSACLYVGKANRDYFLYHGVNEHQLFFSPHSVDNQRFMRAADSDGEKSVQWKESLGIPPENSVALFAGKFEEKKRPLDLLEAFRRAAIERATLVFVGSGPLEAELKRTAADLDSVVFAPFQNQQDMPTVYMAADLLVLPSYGGYETWGLAVNEAMCCACPALVSDHVGCAADLIRPDETGLVFAAGDVDDLCRKLARALADRERLSGWGRAARQLVSDYCYARATDGLRSAIDQLLEAR